MSAGQFNKSGSTLPEGTVNVAISRNQPPLWPYIVQADIRMDRFRTVTIIGYGDTFSDAVSDIVDKHKKLALGG